MSDEFLRLSYFQFDNLVRNRIPFLFLHDEVQIESLYQGMEREHLLRWSFPLESGLTWNEVVKKTESLKLPKGLPVVVVTENLESSVRWVRDLERAGFSNVYWVPGGWNSLIIESQASV